MICVQPRQLWYYFMGNLGKPPVVGVVVGGGWLVNTPATCNACISGTDLLKQSKVMPH